MRQKALTLFALWGLAVAQPVLDLFGRNPEYFVVNGLSGLEIVAFGLAVVVVGPLVLVAIDALAAAADARVGRAVHSLLVGLMATAFFLALLNQLGLDDAAVMVVVAAWLGVVVAYAERRAGWLQTGLTYLAFAPLLFLVAFLGLSESGELVRGAGAAEAEAGMVGRPAPLVILSLDELPVSSLMTSDGSINAERFPNFARLAGTSTWYRDATSVAATTTESVPATLTGTLAGQGLAPTYRDHPRSLFTLLGDAYDQHVVEQVTDLCPPEVCPQPSGLSLDRVRRSFSDGVAVYGHLVAPPSWRDRLPVIDRSWGGFIDAADDGAAASTPVVDAAPTGDADATAADERLEVAADAECPDIELWCAPAKLRGLIAEVEGGGDRPPLYYAHVTTPHLPWILSATGRQYDEPSLVIDGVQPAGDWVPDEEPVRAAFQRHLLQVGAVDGLLGDLIDRLEAEGLWDDAMVVVVADHGISFSPGTYLRAPGFTTLHEIYNVPLFVKAPGQRAGEVSDANALTIDVLPTIVDLLDIDTDWELDGQSLADPGPRRTDKPVTFGSIEGSVPPGVANVLAVVERNRSFLPHGDDWLSAMAAGPYGDLVGTPLDQLDVSGPLDGRWSVEEAAVLADWDPASGPVPVLLHGRLVPGAGGLPTDALVSVNGTVAGVATAIRPGAAGEVTFEALVAEELLRPGPNDLTLLLPTSIGTRRFAEAPLDG